MAENGGAAGIEFGFTIVLVRNREKKRVQAKARFPTLDSARDTLLVFAIRDPRVIEVYVNDAKTGEILWSSAPGVIMAALAGGGLGPALIDLPR